MYLLPTLKLLKSVGNGNMLLTCIIFSTFKSTLWTFTNTFTILNLLNYFYLYTCIVSKFSYTYTIVAHVGAKAIETIGWEKVGQQQAVESLREVALNGSLVYGVGSARAAELLEQHCAFVKVGWLWLYLHLLFIKLMDSYLYDCLWLSNTLQELDLSNTLLPSWTAIARICTLLPHLVLLDVGTNRIPPPDEHTTCESTNTWQELAPTAFRSLRTLHIPYMNYNWLQVTIFLSLYMYLSFTSLFICNNFHCISTSHGNILFPFSAYKPCNELLEQLDVNQDFYMYIDFYM